MPEYGVKHQNSTHESEQEWKQPSMDLTQRVKSFRSRQRQVLSWILSTGRPVRTVVAMGNRLTLLLIGQVLAKPESLVAAVTTEDEAIESIKRHRPSLLICEAPLESGCVISLCIIARAAVADIQILVLISEREDLATWLSLDPLVDVAVATKDLGDDDYPLVRGFIELARKRRYRSKSIRSGTSEHAEEHATRVARLTPREVEVLALVGQGMRDKEIAVELGISHQTARTYVKDVRRKLGAKSRTSAVMKGLARP
jgi:DNA-binding NarL/FixJ family response regulator